MTKSQSDPAVAYGDLLVYLIKIAWVSWGLMLLFGVLHASAHGVPSFGFWQSTFAVFVLSSIVELGTLGIYARVKYLAPLYGKKKAAEIQIDGQTIKDALLKYNRGNN